MKKLIIAVLAVVMAVSMLAVPAAVGANPGTIVLGGDVATAVNAQGSSLLGPLGTGSWAAVSGDSTATGKMELYIDPTMAPFDSLGTFTIDEIASISYSTNKAGAQGDPDFYLAIYTVGDGNGWYGYRLNAEPLYSNGLNASAANWNQWSTADGANQLTFFDSNTTVAGFYNGPTLADLQLGAINWATYPYSGSGSTDIDYGAETVKYITFQTGTSWCGTFEGNIDAITIELTTGPSLTIDLEEYSAAPVTTTADIPVKVSLSVTPTLWDFGTIFPGQNSANIWVTVTNTGTVPIGVTTELRPTGTVFDTCLYFPTDAPGGLITAFALTNLAGGDNYQANAQLKVPRDYPAEGVETATVIFWAVP